MRLMCLIIFLHGLLALLLSSHLGVITGEGNHAAQETDIPPQVAQEMADLKKILLDSPGDPAVLFNLALVYATIGDKTKAFKLLEEMSSAHAGLDPQPPA